MTATSSRDPLEEAIHHQNQPVPELLLLKQKEKKTFEEPRMSCSPWTAPPLQPKSRFPSKT